VCSSNAFIAKKQPAPTFAAIRVFTPLGKESPVGDLSVDSSPQGAILSLAHWRACWKSSFKPL
jgi:hypothetical protein